MKAQAQSVINVYWHVLEVQRKRMVVSSHRRVRVAVAGLGVVAQAVYLPLLARHRELFELAAVCDLSPELCLYIGEAHGIPMTRRYTELGKLLDAGGIDGVLLLTSGSHGTPALTTLQAGVAVLCEKPLAWTIEEADALLAAAAHGVLPRLQLGYMKEHDPAVHRCAELLAGIDGLRSVEISVLHPPQRTQLALANVAGGMGVDPLKPTTSASWERCLWERALGSLPDRVGRLYSQVVLGSIIHDIYLTRTLVGTPERFDHVDVWPDDTFPPCVSITGTVAGGVGFSVRWHYLPGYPHYREMISFHHVHGTVELCFPTPYLLNGATELTVTDADRCRTRHAVLQSTTEAFEEQLLAFHAMVTQGTPPFSSIAEGREDIIICQRVMRRYCEHIGLPIGGEAATA